MATSKLFIAAIVLSLFLLHVVEAQQVIESHGPKRSLLGIIKLTSPFIPSADRQKTNSYKNDCGAACIARCRLSRRPNLCHRACGTCCARCGCVPPGTSGNQELCACYYNQTTHGGRRKCP